MHVAEMRANQYLYTASYVHKNKACSKARTHTHTHRGTENAIAKFNAHRIACRDLCPLQVFGKLAVGTWPASLQQASIHSARVHKEPE